MVGAGACSSIVYLFILYHTITVPKQLRVDHTKQTHAKTMMNKFRSCCSKIASFTQRRGFQSTKKQMGGDAHHKPAEINTHGKKFNMFEQYPEFDPMTQIPTRELLLARIAGASATFYVLYMIKNHGGHVFVRIQI